MESTTVHVSIPLYQRLVAVALAKALSVKVVKSVIGERCLAVQTTSGIGLAFTPDEVKPLLTMNRISLLEEQISAMPLTDLIGWYLEVDPLRVAIALAAINSLFAAEVPADKGLFWQELEDRKRLGMVGFFAPMLPRLHEMNLDLVIFELRNIPGTYSPERAAELLIDCDAVIITGAAFANKTVHSYFPYISPEAKSFILGHSTPVADFLLDSFSLGSSIVVDPPLLFEKIRTGARMREVKPALRKTFLPVRLEQRAMSTKTDN